MLNAFCGSPIDVQKTNWSDLGGVMNATTGHVIGVPFLENVDNSQVLTSVNTFIIFCGRSKIDVIFLSS